MRIIDGDLINCKNCRAEIEYEPWDLYSKNEGNKQTWYLLCPRCSKQIDVKIIFMNL